MMNLIHRRYCRSGHWKHHLNDLLPWATTGVRLDGASVLELGSGPGQTTDWLRTRVGTLTAVEYDQADAEALRARLPDVHVVHGDATDLPFEAGTFDTVVCFTMLHHIPTSAGQDRVFSEAARVLKDGGTFAGSDSRWGPLFALAHVGDTMALIDPGSLADRLHKAGFADPQVTEGRKAVRFHATTRSK